MLTPEQLEQERRRLELEQSEREAKATLDQRTSTPKPATSNTPQEEQEQVRESVSPAEAARTAEVQQPDRDRGLITQVGEGLDYVISGDVVKDATNAVAAGVNRLTPEGSPIKSATQSVDDFILGAEETKDFRDQQIKDYRESGQDGKATALSALVGATEGSQAGVLAPVTLTGRALNQATPWSDRPEILRDSPVGEAVFNITEVLVPSLITGGVAPGISGAAGFVAVEAGVETAISQETNDDLIAGRTVARAFGEIANFLGYDGGLLTQELIEGKTVKSQAFTAVIGYLQNLGINIGINQVTEGIGKQIAKNRAKQAAEAQRRTTVQPPKDGRYYHGTSYGYRGIKEEGFRSSTDTDWAEDTGHLLGDGVYFSTDPAYAASYGRNLLSGKPEDVGLRIKEITREELEDIAEANGGFNEYDFLADGQALIRLFGDDYDGVRYVDFDAPGPGSKTGDEIVIFDPAKADQLVAPKSDIAADMYDINMPAYRPNAEPTDVITADTATPTSKPSKGNKYVNDEALAAELKSNGLDPDGLTAANRIHFDNLDRVKSLSGMEQLLDEASRASGKILNNAPKQRREAIEFARSWWFDNANLIDEGAYDAVSLNFAADMTRTLDSKVGQQALVNPDIDKYLREYAETTGSGSLAAALVGESMGLKGIKLATIATNLDSVGIDFTKTVDEFAQLVDKAELFRIPELRSSRNWHLTGELKQRRALKDAGRADVIEPGKGRAASADAPSAEFETKIEGSSFRQLWERAKDGDTGALQTVKQYMRAVASVPPNQALGEIVDLNKVARQALSKGTAEAAGQLYYASMLTQVSTQTASVSSSIARMVSEPLGAIASPLLAGGKTSDMITGIGQLKGTLGSLRNGLRTARQSFASELPLNSGTKLDMTVKAAVQRATEMDAAYQGAVREFNEQGISKYSFQRLALDIEYNYQRWSNNPVNRYAARLLMAADDGFKVAYASQYATGKAYMEAWANADMKNLNTYIDGQMRNVFQDGVESGRITNANVLDAAKNFTFQQDIPINGNVVDDMFLGAKAFADKGGIAGKAFFPFVRASYSILETSARYEPTGLITRMVPRYRAILDGKMGDAARLQLLSQQSFGKLWCGSMVGVAMFGGMTGHNTPDGVPKTSFLIPAPGTEKGYIAVDYSRLEPFAGYAAVIADMVNMFKDGAISEQDYGRIASELQITIAMSLFDKTFSRGLSDMAALLDFKDSEWKLGQIGMKLGQSAVGTAIGAPAAMTRMIGRWSNPYATAYKDPNDPLKTFLNGVRSRLTGGVGAPRIHDVFTGEPIARTPTAGQNPLVSSVGAMLSDFGWPGSIVTAQENPTLKTLGTLGFDISDGIETNSYDSIGLSPEQVSKFTKAIAVEGNLNARLTRYFNSADYASKREKMQAATKVQGTSSDGSAADRSREIIFRDIRLIIRSARDDAARAVLLNDPQYVSQRQLSKGEVPVESEPKPNSLQAQAQGLLTFAQTGQF